MELFLGFVKMLDSILLSGKGENRSVKRNDCRAGLGKSSKYGSNGLADLATHISCQSSGRSFALVKYSYNQRRKNGIICFAGKARVR